jgi:hypothetical protein
MIIGAVSGRGILPLIKVPSNVKINADYYIKHVLKPILEYEVPKKCPGELDKVFFHHDKASSHTAAKTMEYFKDVNERLGINFIRNKDIPVKSPDASLCDFWAFGKLKQDLFNSKASTINGLWKVCNTIWNKIPLNK